MKFLLLIAVGVMSVVADESIDKWGKDESSGNFSVRNTQFSADLYRELVKTNSGNFLVCPISADIALALVHSGAKGQTAQQLASALHLPENTEKIHKIFTQLTSSFKHTYKYSLSSANKVYIKDDFKISDSFKSAAVNVFDAEIQNIDFDNKTEAVSEMNKWVEDKTENKIKDLIHASDVDATTRAIIINSMFFRGTWEHRFRYNETTKKPFHLNSKDQVETDMMYVKGCFGYHESAELNAKILVLPYKGTISFSKFNEHHIDPDAVEAWNMEYCARLESFPLYAKAQVTMTIVLPNDVEGLGALETHIADVLAAPYYGFKAVEVKLPKFKIESKIQFIPILQALGIKDAFENSADFSAMTTDNERVKISKVIQKTFIEVDEKGTPAATEPFEKVLYLSSGVEMRPTEFIADHPFIFYLKYGSNILFVGRYVTGAN